MMIIDVHSHIYPEKIAEKAAAAIGAFYNRPMRWDGRAETLIETDARSGIGLHIISSVATAPKQTEAINRFLADAAAANPGHFIAYGTIHPDNDDKGDILKAFRDTGLTGIKIHPDFQKTPVDAPGFCEIFEAATALNLPVLCHAGDNRYDYSNPGRIRHVMDMFPRLRFIAAHLGGWTIWDEAYAQLAPVEGLMVDTCSALFALPPEKSAEIIRVYGAERVLFGTDFPMWDPAEEVERVRSLPLTEREKELILGKNAMEFLGIEG